MDEKDSERALNDLGTRLKQARKAQKRPNQSDGPRLKGEASGFGQAMRMGAELISALIVGTGLGWFLDRWLDTRPLLMIVFIFLGGAAGILNVYRVAMRMADDATNGAESKALGTGNTDSGAKEHEK